MLINILAKIIEIGVPLTHNIKKTEIKVLSVHWSKSRHILVAHVSNVMNENTLNKIPVCLSVCMSVCMFPWVPRKVAHDSLKNG